MSKIIATYRYIPFGTKVNIVTSNNLQEACELYAAEFDADDDYSEDQALFIQGKMNEIFLAFRSNVTISDIIHEVTHMVEHVLDFHGVAEDGDEYSELMAYGISFWSELILVTFVKNMPMTTAWVREYAKIPDQYLIEL
jgi:hypothetical protein